MKKKKVSEVKKEKKKTKAEIEEEEELERERREEDKIIWGMGYELKGLAEWERDLIMQKWCLRRQAERAADNIRKELRDIRRYQWNPDTVARTKEQQKLKESMRKWVQRAKDNNEYEQDMIEECEKKISEIDDELDGVVPPSGKNYLLFKKNWRMLK
jgi:hypothetical protein